MMVATLARSAGRTFVAGLGRHNHVMVVTESGSSVEKMGPLQRYARVSVIRSLRRSYRATLVLPRGVYCDAELIGCRERIESLAAQAPGVCQAQPDKSGLRREPHPRHCPCLSSLFLIRGLRSGFLDGIGPYEQLQTLSDTVPWSTSAQCMYAASRGAEVRQVDPTEMKMGRAVMHPRADTRAWTVRSGKMADRIPSRSRGA